MRVSVIVPALNAAATIGETLEALRHQELEEPYEVIVVDDGSTDDTVEIAERFLTPSAVVRQRRLGAAAARNRGASAARGSVLAFTDADCAPVPQWLAAGLAAIGHVDLVQGAVRATPGERIGPFDRSLWVDRESGFYESANLFVRRELFDQLGGFESWLDPKLGRPLGEDAWFGWRARRAGARTCFSPAACVHHAVFRRTLREYAGERRRLRHFPGMAARMPELRRHTFFARCFLSRRSAAFDAALIGVATGALARSPLPFAAAAPYAWVAVKRSRRWRQDATVALAGAVAADAMGFVSLARGSVESRTVLL